MIRTVDIKPHVRPKPPLPRLAIEPSKLTGRSSEYCPHCLREGHGLVKRKREYILVGPLFRSECDQTLQILEPRVSARRTWWNKGFIRWLIAPPDPQTDYPWFESKVHATCPRHGTENIWELEGIRQFGRIRLLIIWFEGKIYLITRIVPNH